MKKQLTLLALVLLSLAVLFIDPVPHKQQITEGVSYNLPTDTIPWKDDSYFEGGGPYDSTIQPSIRIREYGDTDFYTPKQMVKNLLHKWFKNKKYCRDYRTSKICRCA